MDIQLNLTDARQIAEQAYDGGSDVLTVVRQPGEDTGRLDWWRTDPGRRKNKDRGWRGRRDWAALATYRDLSRHAVTPIPPDEFPTEFCFADGGWCRPDKEIIKQGLRRSYLEPVIEGRVVRFRITEAAFRDLQRLFPNSGAG